jgi:hypothetical protein
MKYSRNLLAVICTLACGLLLINKSAIAQDPLQVLDTVTLNGSDIAIELNTDDTPHTFDSLVPRDTTNDPGRDFVDCVRTPTTGLTCIDDDDIRFWQNPVGPITGSETETLFNFSHTSLPFNTRKGNGCTAIARDMSGGIYLGGRLNGTANILIKVIEDTGGGCTAPFLGFSSGTRNFCWATIGTGRPRIEDIDVLESSQADEFSADGKALLVLEEKKTVLSYHNFVDDPGNTIIDEIGSGKRDFGLSKNEQIQNSMLMEYVSPVDDSSEFFVVVATDHGNLIAVTPDGSSSDVAPFSAAGLSDVSPSCPPGDDSFDLAQGPDGGLVYVTDRNACVLHAIPFEETDNFTGFDGGSAGSYPTVTEDETEAVTYMAPLTISVFPGIGFDLNSCVGAGCILISSDGVPAATLADVNVVSVPSGVVLFHEKSVPHCGWIPNTCADVLGWTTETGQTQREWLCDPAQNVLRPIDSTIDCETAGPEFLVFNVTPLLSEDITDQIELTGQPSETPAIIFPPEYRAQVGKDYLFDLLAFVPEPDVETDGVLTLDVNVSLLTSGPPGGPARCGNEPGTWDVMLRASERWRSPDAPYSQDDANFQGTLINADCFNPTVGRAGGISIFPVDFELTSWPATIQSNGTTWASDSCPPSNLSCTFDDAVFAKLHVKLFDELLAHLLELACTNTDSGQIVPMSNPEIPIAPLSPGDCATLEAKWWTAKDKLSKGLLAVINQSSSAPNQNFQAFLEAFDQYRNILLNANTMGRDDPANRVGEQAARLETLEHVFLDKVLPTTEPDGYFENDSTWAEYP